MALCVKGRYGYDFVHHPDRLTRPLVRKYLLDDVPARPRGAASGSKPIGRPRSTLPRASCARYATRTAADSVGVLSSAKCTNEENYVLQKFTRAVIGTNNVDHCARL